MTHVQETTSFLFSGHCPEDKSVDYMDSVGPVDVKLTPDWDSCPRTKKQVSGYGQTDVCGRFLECLTKEMR
jgi:hypothetical protein